MVDKISKLIEERDTANADWHRMRDLHASAITDLRAVEVELAIEREANPNRVICPKCQANLPCESCKRYSVLRDELEAERERWRAVACNVKDGTAAAEAERDRLREALTEAKAQIGHGAFCNCVVCLPLIAALAAPTSKEGT